MKSFTNVRDLGSLNSVLKEASEIKKNRFAYKQVGENKTLLMAMFGSSLRTRLSTQKAAYNLGMNVMILDIIPSAWRIETEHGVVMNGDKAEHIQETIPVMANYCDIIGVLSPAQLENREDDYSEKLFRQFVHYSKKPVFSMEGGSVNPLQALADLITIEEFKTKDRPKVVLSWAPHPRSLSQAVPNSFADFMNEADVEFVITHPEGYELTPQYSRNAKIEYNQSKAFEGADFVYAKNWSPFEETTYGTVVNKDKNWTIDSLKMNLTNSAYFMHSLPARRNVVVSDDVIEGPRSIVIQQAANREIASQLILKRMLEASHA